MDKRGRVAGLLSSAGGNAPDVDAKFEYSFFKDKMVAHLYFVLKIF